MSGTEPHDLTLDHLREIRDVLRRVEHDMQDLKEGQIGIRTELHGLRGDVLRQEHALSRLDQRVSRIEDRLSLVES